VSASVGAGERQVDAGHVDRQRHHHPARQREQVAMAQADGGVEHCVDDLRDPIRLVPRERVAAEQPVLEPPPGDVVVAVEVDDHAAHQAVAGVVQCLAELATAEGVACVVVGGQCDHGPPTGR
jgi:hypothetical protein